MFSLLFLTVNVHHKQPQQVIDFSLFLCALYLLWNNFLISEMTSKHMNNTTKKTPCQPQSVHSLGMLIENVTLPQLLDFGLWTRSIWDLRFFGILRSVDWWFLADVSGQQLVVVKFSQRCWWRFKSSGTYRPVVWSIYLHLQGQQSKMKTLRSTETSVTLHQSTGRNLHHTIGHPAGSSYCVRRVFLRASYCVRRVFLRICEDHCRIHKSPILDIFFIPCIMTH